MTSCLKLIYAVVGMNNNLLYINTIISMVIILGRCLPYFANIVPLAQEINMVSINFKFYSQNLIISNTAHVQIRYLLDIFFMFEALWLDVL